MSCKPCTDIRRMMFKNPAEAVRMLLAYRAAQHATPSKPAMEHYRKVSK